MITLTTPCITYSCYELRADASIPVRPVNSSIQSHPRSRSSYVLFMRKYDNAIVANPKTTMMNMKTESDLLCLHRVFKREWFSERDTTPQTQFIRLLPQPPLIMSTSPRVPLYGQTTSITSSYFWLQFLPRSLRAIIYGMSTSRPHDSESFKKHTVPAAMFATMMTMSTSIST